MLGVIRTSLQFVTIGGQKEKYVAMANMIGSRQTMDLFRVSFLLFGSSHSIILKINTEWS